MKITPEVWVDPTKVTAEALGDQEFCTATALFRESAHLEAVVPLAIGGSCAPAFTAVSVGCSYGAEVDTLAAIGRRHQAQKMRIVGLDTNPEAIDCAKTPEYRVHDLGLVEAPMWAQELEGWGFKTNEGTRLVDASLVRDGVSIEFLTHDLGQASLELGDVSLAACHNVLPYVVHRRELDVAAIMVENMVDMLVPGGILSISSDTGFFEKIPIYRKWHHAIAEILVQDVGLRALGGLSPRLPTIFSVPHTVRPERSTL